MDKNKLIADIMAIVDVWESQDKSDFIREELLTFLPVEVLKAILVVRRKKNYTK